MGKYKARIKAKINIYKDIEVIADDDIQAKQKIMELSSKMLDDSRKVIEENDKDIQRNMSYWDYGKIEKVQNKKGHIIFFKADNKKTGYVKIINDKSEIVGN